MGHPATDLSYKPQSPISSSDLLPTRSNQQLHLKQLQSSGQRSCEDNCYSRKANGGDSPLKEQGSAKSPARSLKVLVNLNAAIEKMGSAGIAQKDLGPHFPLNTGGRKVAGWTSVQGSPEVLGRVRSTRTAPPKTGVEDQGAHIEL
ncbi:hypothetical protein DSO57_1015528 [Entomophthora muscae]|uniref:Uncharacterized protein n=1 Tax=Entomophthora muscae TaxID=34485 RepID=A0ACC2RJQ6_9FUNG|nr:hypothetical protein DSO57_1015528 [Entomophthora muscae]